MFKNYKLVLLLCLLLGFTSCSDKKPNRMFVYLEDSGIDFSNTLNPTTQLNILNYLYYYNGSGVAVGGGASGTGVSGGGGGASLPSERINR